MSDMERISDWREQMDGDAWDAQQKALKAEKERIKLANRIARRQKFEAIIDKITAILPRTLRGRQ